MALHTLTSTVYTARSDDVEQVSVTLSRAFFDDPVIAWIVPDPGRRRMVLPGMFRTFASAFVRHNESLVTSDGAGAALWAPPGVPAVADHEAERFGRELEKVTGADAPRLFAVDELMAAHHPQAPCYHLQLVGVDPERQGRGVGSALLTPVLDRCDRDGVPAYLEATSLRNRRLYERHGFQTREVLQIPGGPAMWAMWREPTP